MGMLQSGPLGPRHDLGSNTSTDFKKNYKENEVVFAILLVSI